MCLIEIDYKNKGEKTKFLSIVSVFGEIVASRKWINEQATRFGWQKPKHNHLSFYSIQLLSLAYCWLVV